MSLNYRSKQKFHRSLMSGIIAKNEKKMERTNKLADTRQNNENTSLILIALHTHRIQFPSIPRSHNKISFDDSERGNKRRAMERKRRKKNMGIKYDTQKPILMTGRLVCSSD